MQQRGDRITECCILQNIRSSPEWVEWEAARALARSGEEVELTGEEPRPVELGRGRGVSVS